MAGARRLLVVIALLHVSARAADPTLRARLDEAVRRTAGAGFRGAVLVAQDGVALLSQGYGKADFGSAPVTPRSLFDIASVSKTFTAAAVLRLEQEGRLRTSDRVARHLPRVPKDKAMLTIDHLLTHASGLPQRIPGLGPRDSADRDRYAARLLAAPLAAPPGTRVEYSNHGYGLLAVLVERVSGKRFERYLHEALFAPAGMADTGFLGEDGFDRARLTRRARQDAGTAADFPWDWSMRGSGGVVSTAEDLWRWDRALRAGRVLGPAARRKHVEHVREGFARGWMVGALAPDGGTAWVFHTGRTRGYQAYVARWVAEDRFLVVLTDEATDPRSLHGPLLE